MIPFASQRGGGQDLATHLMNEHDNDYMELAALRGAVAQDLHGAFAEWEAQAVALTRCRNYLYSLSVNPDPAQGPLSREQYFDYIENVEDRLGLTGQPRAVIFHIKQHEHGRMREHCHVVWSRIDADQGKAVQMAFDHDKLMMVTRLFAREHGLTLPDGYHQDRDGKNRQLSLYEKVQQDECGISMQERMALITQLWQRSDSAKAFVQALEQNGYILATGKRPFVLVDIYGHTNALPKLIDDRQVRTSDVRAFLGADYAPENLPGVEQAQALAAQHRKAIDEFEKVGIASNKLAVLEKNQLARREKLEAQLALLKQRQHEARVHMAGEQKAARRVLKADYLAEKKRIRIERSQRKPRGLAAFLGRVTGVKLVTKKVYAYRDRKRYAAYLLLRDELRARQQAQRQRLTRRQELQAADVQRKLRGFSQVEKRERKSLETAGQKERRQRINARHGHMPALALELKPRGRKAALYKAKQRHISPLARELAEAARNRKARKTIKLAEEFGRASGSEGDDGKAGDSSSGAPKPTAEQHPERRQHKRVRLTEDFKRAADDGKGEAEGGAASSDGPKPASEKKVARRQRRKDRPEQKAARTNEREQHKAKERDQEQQQERQRRRRRKRDLDRGM